MSPVKKPKAKPRKLRPAPVRTAARSSRKTKSLAQVRGLIDDARVAYISGIIPARKGQEEIRHPSLDDVARIYGLAIRTVHRRSQVEGWVKLKAEHEEATRLAERQALLDRNARLVQQLGDAHARTRVGFLNSALRLQQRTDAAVQGTEMDATGLSAAGSALRKAQDMADIAIVGPKAPAPATSTPPPVNVNVGVAVPGAAGGWATVSSPPAPLTTALVALEQEEEASK